MHYADLELVVTNERGEDASYDSILRLFIKHIRKGNGIVDFPPTYRAKSIHATGCGNNGALGLGNEEDRKEYEKIENVTNIYTFATGGDHAHASTKHGLYSWGSGRFSQLGATGRVYVWGSSGTSAATLGLGDRVTVVKSPTLIGSLSDKQIRRIYCGKSSCFSFALTMHGDMYAFGQNTSAQLGFGDFVTRSRPEKCNKISRVAVMTTSLSSVVCVNTEGLMFTWGGNSGSLFQIGSTRGNVIIPTEIPIARGKDIIQVDCTWDTVIALSRGGDIYTWGKHKDVLKQLFSNIPLRSLSCGKNHVLAEAKSGEFYGWTTNDETVVPKRGYNETGLTKMDLKNTFKLVAGDRFTFALSDEDTI